MKKIYAILCLIISFSLFAQDVDIVLDPKVPVAGEQFDIIFKIKLKGSVKPRVSFSPGRLKVLGQRSGGMSINTSIINGRFTTIREMTYIFTLSAPEVGTYPINDVALVWSGGRKALASMEIKILKQRAQARNYFLIAIPSKTVVYFNEGIDVNYYLYFRPSIRLTGEGIEEFPKFPKFIKRFHQVKPTMETVTYKGGVFRRRLFYSARVYPEKVGNLVIDPLKVTIQYFDNSEQRDPFGGFGAFGLRSRQTRQVSVASKEVKIKVRPFPAKGKPPNFVGLVGDHSFKIEIGRNKFLLNEAIELKLTVEGPGALEHFDAPALYQTDALEEFDTNSELTEIGITRARKTFDYTYLAKAPINLDKLTKSFFVFDPDKKKYLKKEILLPGIKIAGVATKAHSSRIFQKRQDPIGALDVTGKNLLAPVFASSGHKSWLDYVITFLALVLLAQFIEIFYGKLKKPVNEVNLLKLCKKIERDGPDYSSVHQLILQLAGGQKVAEPSISRILEESGLSPQAKKYFRELIKYAESRTYKKNYGGDKFNFNQKYFKEFLAQAFKK
ncbi:MAG: hypothetical protein DRQ88_10000 [Epsilonproteobacteria bacterium]|nr:MAG: hypothetical protein DRQ88_10000 [Campylobacterota bacterium]RLA65204.1 MAG: hypothetical protein DRQ89_01635 [Campylobacterota bacterium]